MQTYTHRKVDEAAVIENPSLRRVLCALQVGSHQGPLLRENAAHMVVHLPLKVALRVPDQVLCCPDAPDVHSYRIL